MACFVVEVVEPEAEAGEAEPARAAEWADRARGPAESVCAQSVGIASPTSPDSRAWTGRAPSAARKWLVADRIDRRE